MFAQAPMNSISSLDISYPTSTSTKHSRRSLIMMANNLKPTRQKLQKYFTRSRHSVPESELKNWHAKDLDSALKLASMQTGSSGNPQIPISPVVQDSKQIKPALCSVDTELRPQHQHHLTPKVESMNASVFPSPPETPSPSPPQHIHLPRPVRPVSFVDASVPSFQLSPPPPAPPEVVRLPQICDTMSMEIDPTEPRLRRGPSIIKPRPISGIRRAKTPVRKIGQLEMAAAKKRQEAAVNRQSSVRSIARQYRALIEETDIPEVPLISSIHRKPLPATAEPHLQELDRNSCTLSRHSVIESRGAGLFESPRPRYRLAPSSVVPIADSMASLRDDGSFLKPLMFPSPPNSPPVSEEEDCCYKDGAIKSSCTDALRFQIGFELLTRELSAAFANHSARTSRDATGLQIWVMIEAYERLRDQISFMEVRDPQLRSVRAMFDSWLGALRAIQKYMADEAAESESEYADG